MTQISVEEALNLLRASLPAMIQIRALYAPDLPLVSADATQIHQIVMNLGTNAGYAMGENGGVLSIELDRVTINEAAIPSSQLSQLYYALDMSLFEYCCAL